MNIMIDLIKLSLYNLNLMMIYKMNQIMKMFNKLNNIKKLLNIINNIFLKSKQRDNLIYYNKIIFQI